MGLGQKNDCDVTFTGIATFDIDASLATDWNLIGWYSAVEAILGEESVVGNPLDVTPTNSLTSVYRYKRLSHNHPTTTDSPPITKIFGSNTYAI